MKKREIRQAIDSDINSLIEFDHVAQVDETRRDFIVRAVQAQSIWVCVIDGQLCGFVIVEYTFFGQGFISLLYVDPTYRRQGIGSALIAGIEAICTTEKLFTSTNESNRPMHVLLAKSRFVPSGVVNNLDEGDPEIIYFKRIKQS